ncbi:MAG: DUF4838 domain-containing protein [Candidatus Omnitrophica bacterium]|nr:DUF4838 domain-containing protein [Candidatus Omnitrophota bacterium]
MSAGNAGAAVTLVKDGKSSAVIVVDDNAAPNAKYAANELQTYLEKLSGARLSISNTPGNGVNIFVGEGAATRAAGLSTDGLKYDGFQIVTRGDKAIYLFGRDYKKETPLVAFKSPFEAIHIYNKKFDICAFGEAGTLYAVYHFLRENCGVRWFMPGELGEVVPKMKTITVNKIDFKKSPDFYYRVIYVGLFNLNDDAVLWYRRAGFGAPFPVYINHSFYDMKKYYPAHPEYFALLKNGERDYNTTCLGDGNLCLSNLGLLQQFVDDICRYFDAHPEQSVFAVMPNDHLKGICECSACQAQADYDKPENGKFSNYVWGFVNKVAKEVGKRYPEKLIGCAAYSSWQMIPDRVKLEPNVAVMFTKAVAWRFDDAYRVRNDVNAYKWAELTKNFFTWDYYCWDMTNSHLTGLPILFSKWLDTDIKRLKGKSNGAFIEVEKGYYIAYPEMNHLNIYLTGKLLWDADSDVTQLLKDYYEKFYGPAAPEMEKFWTYAEAIWTKMEVKDRSSKADLSKTLYTETVLKKLKSHLEAAIAAVEPGSAYAKRIAGIQNHFYPYVDRVSNTRSRRPSYIVKRTTEPPVIDGCRNETLWQKAEVLDFVRQTDAKPPLTETFVRMLYDDENLYIMVDADEPAMDKLVAKATANDSLAVPYIWEDDALEIFIAPDRENPDSCGQIIINTKGMFLDGWFGSERYASPNEFTWNSNLTYHISKERNRWSAEIAIPLSSLSVDGKKVGSEWAMNICRDRAAAIEERSAWASTISESWRIPSRFGFVTLEK